MEKDYYRILGVSNDASDDEIKKAYRHLASIYHPDVSHDPNAEGKMKLINEAYSVLKNTESRANYDQYGNTQSEYFDKNFNPNKRYYEYSSGYVYPKSAINFGRIIVFFVFAAIFVNLVSQIISDFGNSRYNYGANNFYLNYERVDDSEVAVSSVTSRSFLPPNVQSVTIPSFYRGYRVVKIKENTFKGLKNLNTLYLPSSVTVIGENAFYNCRSLDTIYYYGTEDEFNQISIGTGNDYFLDAMVVYLSDSL